MKLTNEQIKTKYPETAERIIGERRVIRRLVSAAIATGYLISLNDGEEWVVHHTNDLKEIMDNIMSTDEDYIRVGTGPLHAPAATFRLIYGNSPAEVIADCSTNKLAQTLCEIATKGEE